MNLPKAPIIKQRQYADLSWDYPEPEETRDYYYQFYQDWLDQHKEELAREWGLKTPEEVFALLDKVENTAIDLGAKAGREEMVREGYVKLDEDQNRMSRTNPAVQVDIRSYEIGADDMQNAMWNGNFRKVVKE